MTSLSASQARSRAPALAGLAAALLGLAALAGPAAGQDRTVVVGGISNKEVTVDLSVLDNAGPGAPGGRRDALLFPGSQVRPGERIVLTPPGMMARRPAPRQRTRRPPQAVARAPAVTPIPGPRPQRRPPAAKPPPPPTIAMPAPARPSVAKREPVPPIASIKPAAGPSAAAKAKPPTLAAPTIRKRTSAPPDRQAAIAKGPAAPKAPAPAARGRVDIPPPPPVPEAKAAPRTPVASAPVDAPAPPAAVPTGTKEKNQVAAIARPGGMKRGAERRILFQPGSASLPEDGKAAIAAIAKALASDPALRVELKAYARGGSDNVSQARRLSLSRALAIRSELMRQGVRSTRIDVRALGNRVPSGVPDRADLLVFTR